MPLWLVFPGFEGPDRSFWPDVCRDIRPKTFSLRSCRSSSVNLFLIFRREIWKILWEIWRELSGDFFWPTEQRLENLGEKFRSIFRKRIRGSKKIFRAKFTLQTHHLSKTSSLGRFSVPEFDWPWGQPLKPRGFKPGSLPLAIREIPLPIPPERGRESERERESWRKTASGIVVIACHLSHVSPLQQLWASSTLDFLTTNLFAKPVLCSQGHPGSPDN